MGSKLESVRQRLEGAKEVHSSALERAREDVSEMQEIRSVLDGMPTDMDDDLLECVEQVSDSSTEEATDHMESDVHGELDEGSREAEDVSQESEEQRGLSEDAAGKFDEVAGHRFGSRAADGAGRARDAAAGFQETSDSAQESIQEAEQSYQELLSEIRG